MNTLQQPTTTWLDILLMLLPWIFVFLVLMVVLRRVVRTQRVMTAEHIERMRQHMIAVEAKLDRLIEQGETRTN